LTLGLGDISYLDVHTSVEKALSESEEKDERHEYGFPPVRVRHTLI